MCVCVCESCVLYIPKCNIWEEGSLCLLRDVGPVPGSGHHGLGIDGSKSKVVADPETSSVQGPGTWLSGCGQILVS